MPRQDFPVNTALGVDWPHASVDAPDAYYVYVRARVLDSTVAVFDKEWEPLAAYRLDEPPEFSDGSLVGMVNGMPLVVTVGCACDKPVRIVAKGDHEAMADHLADLYGLPG